MIRRHPFTFSCIAAFLVSLAFAGIYALFGSITIRHETVFFPAQSGRFLLFSTIAMSIFLLIGFLISRSHFGINVIAPIATLIGLTFSNYILMLAFGGGVDYWTYSGWCFNIADLLLPLIALWMLVGVVVEWRRGKKEVKFRPIEELAEKFGYCECDRNGMCVFCSARELGLDPDEIFPKDDYYDGTICDDMSGPEDDEDGATMSTERTDRCDACNKEVEYCKWFSLDLDNNWMISDIPYYEEKMYCSEACLLKGVVQLEGFVRRGK